MSETRKHFGSLAAFVDYGNNQSDVIRPSSRKSDSGDWYGTANYLEAVDLAHGWHEGAAKIKRAKVASKPKGRAVRREVVLREVGPGTLSMGNYLSGHPQPYVVMRDSQNVRNGKGKVIKVVVNLFVSAGIDSKVFMTRGGAIVALIEALESAGRRVELTGVVAFGDGSRRHAMEYVVTLKKAEQKLNLPTLAFALAHPSIFRRIGFAALEQESAQVGDRFGRGSFYGFPYTVRDIPADLLIPAAGLGDPAWRSPEAAAKWVETQAEAQGVKLTL